MSVSPAEPSPILPVSHPRSVVLHAHFYQPPREDPWLELVEREHSATPSHDWNVRIERECYRAVVAARLPGRDGHIARIVNTLDEISFNVGPTLLSWLDEHAPDTYRAMLDADRRSVERLGAGNAVAMPYHHVILPLASHRDKMTEVRWGIADFRRRFGRNPEGMWLPETAVDEETLDVLAEAGIIFTILAPHQVHPVPAGGRPGWFRTLSGGHIQVCVYHGPMSHDVAFGPLIRDSAAWAHQVMSAPVPPAAEESALVSIATDGETFGHHHPFGEMALAAVLQRLSREPSVTVENFSSYLRRAPATEEVTLRAPSSWSCSHGVERWRSDCGCRMAPGSGMRQAWRAPLRLALETLADGLHRRFLEEGTVYFADPWTARDDLGGEFSDPTLPTRARELLEMERNALRMFTSCGWFFDDVGGLESLICLRYAGRALELYGQGGASLEETLRAGLARAESNDPAIGTARDIWDREIRSRLPGEVRAAAGAGAVAHVAPALTPARIGVYDVTLDPLTVFLGHRRTGRTSAFRTTVHGVGSEDLRVEVMPVDPEGAPHEVTLSRLPEPERDLLLETRATTLLGVLLDVREATELAAGRTTVLEVVGRALVRHLEHPSPPPGPDLAALHAGLELLALESRPVPFDAQTRFYRLLTGGDATQRRLLTPLATAFGFAPEAIPGNGGSRE